MISFLSLFFFFFFSSCITLSYHCSTTRTGRALDFLLQPLSTILASLMDFRLRLGIMDFLLLDDSGLVPQINCRIIRNDHWIGLNAPCKVIPLEASAYVDFKSNQRISDNFRAKEPTGLYLEMEWALDADWFNPNVGWHPYLLLPSGGDKEWYYQLDQSTLVDPESTSPHFTIFP